ncbi:MAG TPA: creatininase family protein [Streptosporangiaceae bacterium]|nr:creatininase family protein [Streptosporangiaceae bacterium]
MRVEHLTWPEYRDLAAVRIVVLPIGAIDGHGPHLPLSTDTIVSTYLAHSLERHLDVLVLPTVPYGQKTDPPASGGEFPGVTNVRASTLTNVVLDVLRASYRHGARRFLILDSHKANVGAVRESADLFIDGAPGARVMAATWWDLVSEDSRNAIADETGISRQDDHHAAMVETSLMMHIAPDSVRLELLADDSLTRRARYLILPVPDSLKTRTGVVYRASRASPVIGERLVAEIVSNLIDAVKLELG